MHNNLRRDNLVFWPSCNKEHLHNRGHNKNTNIYLEQISKDDSFLSRDRTQARFLSLFSSKIASLKFSGLSAVENRREIRFLNGLTKSISEVFFSGTEISSVILMTGGWLSDGLLQLELREVCDSGFQIDETDDEDTLPWFNRVERLRSYETSSWPSIRLPHSMEARKLCRGNETE